MKTKGTAGAQVLPVFRQPADEGPEPEWGGWTFTPSFELPTSEEIEQELGLRQPGWTGLLKSGGLLHDGG